MKEAVPLVAGACAFVLLPIWYIALCVWLFRSRAWWFDYLAYFALFGSVGGWFFAIAWGPGGIAALSSVFLLSLAVLSCAGSAVVLTFRKKKTRAEWIAMVGGYLYPCILVALFVGFMVFDSHSS
jgi:hypothetical protein